MSGSPKAEVCPAPRATQKNRRRTTPAVAPAGFAGSTRPHHGRRVLFDLVGFGSSFVLRARARLQHGDGGAPIASMCVRNVRPERRSVPRSPAIRTAQRPGRPKVPALRSAR